MKLHTDTNEAKEGLIFKKPIWKMNAQIELDAQEEAVVAQHPEIKKMIVATGTHGSVDIEWSVGMLLKGMKGSRFTSLSAQSEFEAELREGCTGLKGHIARYLAVESGPTTQEF